VPPVRDWLVAADDRTGAFEVAAEIAAVAGPVTVTVDELPPDDGVVDLVSRHLDPDRAATRASAVDTVPAKWTAHKIDSTLRGNWAAELRARRTSSGRRVVILPAWPAMGRTCMDATVHVAGVPVAGVLDALPQATALPDVTALRRWLTGREPFAVCDVPDTETMHRLAEALADADVLVAGPAGPIGAIFAARRGRTVDLVEPPMRRLPALVVCGSATEVSREQLHLLRATRPDVTVLSAPPTTGALRPAVAVALADAARQRMALHEFATVVIVGGDTAAAVLGTAPRSIGGTVMPGLPWSRAGRGDGPLVVTKAGGFGAVDTLVALFETRDLRP
jgi:uncharacterized protein YgbK (DUF1537 family)